MFTVVRLADGAKLDRACELAGIQPIHVDLIQSMAEKVAPSSLQGDFRVISFDGQQITISERIKGERAVKGFAVTEQIGANEPHTAKPYKRATQTESPPE